MSLHNTYNDPTTPDIRILRLRPAGMFSNVNEVIEQLRLAEIGKYQFIIDWSKSCYRDSKRKEDPWSYYFEPCFDQSQNELENFSDIKFLPRVCTQIS